MMTQQKNKPLQIQYLEFFKDGYKTVSEFKIVFQLNSTQTKTIIRDLILNEFLQFRDFGSTIRVKCQTHILDIDIDDEFLKYFVILTDKGYNQLSQYAQERINQSMANMTNFVMYLTFINVIVVILDYLGITGKNTFWIGLFLSVFIAISFFIRDIFARVLSLFDGGIKMCELKKWLQDAKEFLGIWTCIFLIIYIIIVVSGWIWNTIPNIISLNLISLLFASGAFTFAIHRARKSEELNKKLESINKKLNKLLEKE